MPGDILSTIESEFREMPGMCVTTSQAQRLWRLDYSNCLAALTMLVERGILRRTPRGGYVCAAINQRRAVSVLLFTALATFASASPLVARPASQTASRTANPQAVDEFSDAVARYMELRRKLRDEIKSLQPNSTATEIVNTSDALAFAIQRARPHSKPGMFFTVSTTTVLKQRITETVRSENLARALATIDDEEAAPDAVTVYRRFPAASQMATMPPALLAVLPLLPKELEYRIIGRVLVLRDVDAALILDYIPSAIPR